MDKKRHQNFPGGTVDQNSPANAEDRSLIPGPGRFPHAVCITNTDAPHSEPESLRVAAATESMGCYTEACLLRACALQQEKPLHTITREQPPTRHN